MNIEAAMELWLAYRRRMLSLGMVAGSTVANQSSIVGVLAGALGEHELADLRKSHIELWMGERLQTCAPVTVRGELNVLQQLLRWCQDEDMLAVLPRMPKLSVPSVEEALPDDDAFLWVLAHVPAKHAEALEFMMLTGLSPHELERVQMRDARFGEPGQIIRVDEFITPLHAVPRSLGIGQRPDFPVKQPSRRRWVPLSRRADAIWWGVSAGLAPDATVFPSVAAMQKAIRRCVFDAGRRLYALDDRLPQGADQITPKMMRKWFASKVSNEHPEHVLQRLLGHAPGSPITRRHYVKSTEEQVSAAARGVSIDRGNQPAVDRAGRACADRAG